MFNFLKKESNEIVSPIKGICIPIEKVNDQVFASKMMGDGFAIVPNGNKVVSPVDGEIILIPASKHAIGLKTKKGIEILVHIGLDTVHFNGEGFKVLKSKGDKVKAGDGLIEFDSSFMKEKGADMTTMVIFTGGYDKEIKLDCYGKEVNAGEVLIH